MKAEGRINGEVVVAHTRHTPSEPVKLILKADDTALIADGSDMTRLTVMAVDANNQIVPLANNSVVFSSNRCRSLFLGKHLLY